MTQPAGPTSFTYDDTFPPTLVCRLFRSLTLVVAAVILAAVAVDKLRLPINLLSVGIAVLLLLVPLALIRWYEHRRSTAPRATVDWRIEATLLSIAAVIAWCLLHPAWPTMLPLGNSPDAVHHTSLANYIFEHRHLVHDPDSVSKSLIEFADYPPGFAILTMLAAQLFRTLPVQVIYGLAVITVIACVLGVAILIAETVPVRIRPSAALATLLLLLVPEYVLGTIVSESYYAHMLVQWLIVDSVVLLTRQLPRPSVARWLELVVVLLGLTFTYTTWLPVALLATFLSIILQPTPWRHKLLVGALVLLPVVYIALTYSLAHATAGRAVVLIEGSTIRDPIRITGLILPAIALIGCSLGWRTSKRRVVLALLVAAALQTAGLWLLRQRGYISNYAYYKTYYLLVLLMVIPVGWIVADGVSLLLHRWRAAVNILSVIQTALILPIAVGAALAAPPLAALAQPATYPLSKPLLEAGLWIRANGLADHVAYALRKPGLPAYWLQVGVLNQPRTKAAEALLHEPQPSFLLWYLSPSAPKVLLLEQPTPPPEHAGLGARFQNSCCVVLEKTNDYNVALQRLRPLTISYRTTTEASKYHIDLQLYDQASEPDLGIRLVIQAVDHPPITYTLPVPQRAGHAQFLGFTLDPHGLHLSGYINTGTKVPPAPTANQVPVQYRVLLQLIRHDIVLHEAVIGACCSSPDQLELAQPIGEWLYIQPEQPSVAMEPLQLGLGQIIDLEGAAIDHTQAHRGDTVTVHLGWKARQAIDQRYITFVQLVAQDGVTALSAEGEPTGGMAPTWRWHSGDRIDDSWQLTLPSRLQPGRYQVVVGMYDPQTNHRLEAWRRQPYLERFWTDALPLGTVDVQP